MSNNKDFDNLELEQHVYKINENRLPIDSYLKYPPFTHAAFIPYVVSGDAGFAEHRQLNWTNKLLWNKLGKLTKNEKIILNKPSLSEEDKKQLSVEANKIANENYNDRKRYLQELEESLDYKLFKMKKEQEKQIDGLKNTIEELKKELKELKKQQVNPIIPGSSYTINMIRAEEYDRFKFDEYLYFQKINKNRIEQMNEREKTQYIMRNTEIINENLELIYENTKPKEKQRIETILDTPQYKNYHKEQERKRREQEEYEEFQKWRLSREEIKQGKKAIIIPDIPVAKPAEPNIIEILDKLRLELENVKKELHETKQKQQEKIAIIEQEEEDLDPDNLQAEIIEKLEINNIEQEKTESEAEPEINVKIEQEEYRVEGGYRDYKPKYNSYQKDVRNKRFTEKRRTKREEYLNNRRTQFEPTYQPGMDTNITGEGEILNLDCTLPQEAEERVMKWVQQMGIAIVKQDMTTFATQKFIARTLLGNVKQWYDRLTEQAREELKGSTPAEVLNKHELAIRAEFGRLGIETEIEKLTRLKNLARIKIQKLEICQMTHEELKGYICEFQEYYYDAAYTKEEQTAILNMFYSKLPEPWGSTILRKYEKEEINRIQLDSIGSRVTYLEESINQWCNENWMAKATNRYRKTKLDCNYYETGKYGCKEGNSRRNRRNSRKPKKYIIIKRKNWKPRYRNKKYFRPKSKMTKYKKIWRKKYSQ